MPGIGEWPQQDPATMPVWRGMDYWGQRAQQFMANRPQTGGWAPHAWAPQASIAGPAMAAGRGVPFNRPQIDPAIANAYQGMQPSRVGMQRTIPTQMPTPPGVATSDPYGAALAQARQQALGVQYDAPPQAMAPGAGGPPQMPQGQFDMMSGAPRPNPLMGQAGAYDMAMQFQAQAPQREMGSTAINPDRLLRERQMQFNAPSQGMQQQNPQLDYARAMQAQQSLPQQGGMDMQAQQMELARRMALMQSLQDQQGGVGTGGYAYNGRG